MQYSSFSNEVMRVSILEYAVLPDKYAFTSFSRGDKPLREKWNEIEKTIYEKEEID
jgi:hypothetical protein